VQAGTCAIVPVRRWYNFAPRRQPAEEINAEELDRRVRRCPCRGLSRAGLTAAGLRARVCGCQMEAARKERARSQVADLQRLSRAASKRPAADDDDGNDRAGLRGLLVLRAASARERQQELCVAPCAKALCVHLCID
jgi:hypothetical protein